MRPATSHGVTSKPEMGAGDFASLGASPMSLGVPGVVSRSRNPVERSTAVRALSASRPFSVCPLPLTIDPKTSALDRSNGAGTLCPLLKRASMYPAPDVELYVECVVAYT